MTECGIIRLEIGKTVRRRIWRASRMDFLSLSLFEFDIIFKGKMNNC
jgi:hypothetical protein